MITEKVLQGRAQSYAKGVIGCLAQIGGPRTIMWAEVEKLVSAAYFNGFQSGVVWQKGRRRHGGKHNPSAPFRRR